MSVLRWAVMSILAGLAYGSGAAHVAGDGLADVLVGALIGACLGFVGFASIYGAQRVAVAAAGRLA